MGGAHVFSGYCQCLNCDAKKSSFLYKSNLIGNTIIREKNSTKGFIQTFDKKYYISDSYLKDLISIDTELFTASAREGEYLHSDASSLFTFLYFYGQKRLPIPEMCEYSLLILHKAPDTDPRQSCH